MGKKYLKEPSNVVLSGLMVPGSCGGNVTNKIQKLAVISQMKMKLLKQQFATSSHSNNLTGCIIRSSEFGANSRSFAYFAFDVKV